MLIQLSLSYTQINTGLRQQYVFSSLFSERCVNVNEDSVNSKSPSSTPATKMLNIFLRPLGTPAIELDCFFPKNNKNTK